MIRTGTASLVGIALAAAVALWWWAGPAAAALGLAGALVAGAALNAWYLDRLYRWAVSPGATDVPSAPLFWGRLFDRIARYARGEADARRALSRDAAMARAIVDRLPDALILLDARDHVAWTNKAAQAVHGFIGLRRPVQQFLREPEFGAYLRGRRFDRPLRLRLSSSPGRIHEIALHPLEGEQTLLVCRDVTQQAQLDQMRSDFVANVSHEIRTPVTVIGGFAETLLDLGRDLTPDQQREYLSNILRQSQTMQRLVADLLLLSALESGPNVVPEETIPIAATCEQLADEARALSGGRHTILVEPPLRLGVHGNRTEIESALRNLLGNAVRYTPEGGHVRLQCRRQDQDLWISVRDNGIGIAPEHLPRLTERFYRVDRARSRESGGTGLGLAIVKRIASRHGGNLHVESREGVGSTFSLIIPGSRVRALVDDGDRAARASAAA